MIYYEDDELVVIKVQYADGPLRIVMRQSANTDPDAPTTTAVFDGFSPSELLPRVGDKIKITMELTR